MKSDMLRIRIKITFRMHLEVTYVVRQNKGSEICSVVTSVGTKSAVVRRTTAEIKFCTSEV